MDNELDKVPFSRLKRLVETIEHHPQMKDRLDEVEVSFEFIVGSLFPTIMGNVHDALNKEHMNGYLEGLAEKEGNHETERLS